VIRRTLAWAVLATCTALALHDMLRSWWRRGAYVRVPRWVAIYVEERADHGR